MHPLYWIVRPRRLLPDPVRSGEFVVECLCPTCLGMQRVPVFHVEALCASCGSEFGVDLLYPVGISYGTA